MNATTDRKGSAVVSTPSDLEIQIVRKFDHPAELVWRAYTTPELVQRWYGFETSEWLVCEIDLRVGGTWRYVTRDGGFEVAFHGVYQELEAPHRLVSTEVFEGLADMMPGVDPEEAATLNSITFEEADGVTTMTMVVQHKAKEHRDGHLGSGMEGGMQVSMDRLDALVATLAA
jgi:uncharacterized protein YndB with AHSA1/START domain